MENNTPNDSNSEFKNSDQVKKVTEQITQLVQSLGSTAKSYLYLEVDEDDNPNKTSGCVSAICRATKLDTVGFIERASTHADTIINAVITSAIENKNVPKTVIEDLLRNKGENSVSYNARGSLTAVDNNGKEIVQSWETKAGGSNG